MRCRPLGPLALFATLALSACGASSGVQPVARDAVPATSTSVPSTSLAPSVIVTTTSPPASTAPDATTPTTPSTGPDSTTVAPPTVPPSTVQPPAPPSTPPPLPPASTKPLDLSLDQLVLGTSIEGRPIIAERYGTPGGRRVLVIGVIHGNEDGGVPIIAELRRRAISGTAPEGVELWLVESMNPDGQAAQDRHNANDVDLNRNFPHKWGPIGAPGDGQYAGTGPASEPETHAMVAFISQLRPDLAIWYHQDANLIIPSSGRDGRIRARYAELSGLPIADCCDGGVYTGIAATWARNELAAQEGVAFIVELPGGDLDAEQVATHANTVTTIAIEAGSL